MEQAQHQRGQGEQSADRFQVIPEEEMEGQWKTPSAGESDEHVDEGHGHGKKSMLNKMKDKAKTLKTKVKKKITPNQGGNHEENHGESQENSQEATSEEEEGEEDVEEHHQAGDKTGGVHAEAPEPSLGVGNIHQIQEQREEEKPMTTRFGEFTPAKDINDNGKGGYNSADDRDKSVENNFQTTHEHTEPGKAWNQSLSEGTDRGKENLEEFGVYKGTNSPEKQVEEQYQSPEGKVNDNVIESPEKAEPGKSWSERASQGLGFAKGKLQGYGVFTGVKSPGKPEESQSSLGHDQDKVNEFGERKEMGSDMKSPTDTEEIKNGPSERDPGSVKEASILAEEFKKVSSFDQTSSSEKVKDTAIEGENKEKEDEGTQQQQSGEGKESQGYSSKIYSAKDAISSKIGFGGQTDQEPNVIGETKPDDQTRGEEMDIDKKSPSYTEEIKTGPSETSSGYVKESSKLADEFKKVLSFDQTSSNDKAKDTLTEGENKEKWNEGAQQQLSGGEGQAGKGYVSKIYSAKDVISSKLGYGGSDKTKDTLMEGENKEVGDEGTQQQQSGGEGKAGQSYASKIFSAKDAISSKLGYGGGQTNQEPNVIGESKPADQIPRTATESTEGAKESKETLKTTIVSKLSPGEDDKALSEVITGAVSNRAKSLKDSLGGLYGGNGKVSTTDPNMAASGVDSQGTGSNSPGGKGIVDRVTGVVGSLFGSKQGGNSEQHSASEKSEPKSKVQVEEQVPEVPKY